MAETHSIYVLDSFAMLAYFQAEPGGPIVRSLMQAARDRNVTLSMSMINVGEVFYIAARRRTALRPTRPACYLVRRERAKNPGCGANQS